ncbi:MAG TPA: PEGA domain-containing protein [Kofleriaceae bacterium]|nr:PEGA domain-containing protein [Kofleriaceae bacterium]
MPARGLAQPPPPPPAQPAAPPPTAPTELPPSPASVEGAADRVGVVDLARGAATERRARRAAIEKQLAGVSGVRPVDDPELRQALAGESVDPQLESGRRALARAQAAFGALDCTHARGEADAALLALAAVQAASGEAGAANQVNDDLRRAHTIRFLCADQGGDRGAAQSAARALRALKAGDPPRGISDAVWSRYPAIDAAAGVQNGRLSVTTQPAGAAVWIDHAPAGKAPITVSLSEGEHLVAAGSTDPRSGGGVARRVTVATGWAPAQLALALPARAASRWRDVEERVAGWRRGTARPGAADVGQLCARAGLSRVVVIDGRGGIQVWVRAAGGEGARVAGSAGRPEEIAALMAGPRRGPGIDPSRPLLRETPEERAAIQVQKSGKRGKWQQWWVYAVVIGAAALGAGIVLGNDLGEDRQRIEITVP